MQVYETFGEAWAYVRSRTELLSPYDERGVARFDVCTAKHQTLGFIDLVHLGRPSPQEPRATPEFVREVREDADLTGVAWKRKGPPSGAALLDFHESYSDSFAGQLRDRGWTPSSYHEPNSLLWGGEFWENGDAVIYLFYNPDIWPILRTCPLKNRGPIAYTYSTRILRQHLTRARVCADKYDTLVRDFWREPDVE